MARRELIAACGLIGALGGALFGYGIARPAHFHRHFWEPILALTLCTAISATLLGLAVARKPTHEPHVSGARAAGYSFVFGALNGVLMVVSMSLAKGPAGPGSLAIAIAAALLGAVCALPFMPAMAAVAATAARIDARPGSIAERAQRRRVLRVAALCLAIASLVIPPRGHVSLWLHIPLHVTNIALAIVTALVLVEVSTMWFVLGQGRGLDWELATTPLDAPAPIDLGVGGDLWVRRARDETYRTPVLTREAILGDRARALGIVRSALHGHLIAGGIAAASLILQLIMHRVNFS